MNSPLASANTKKRQAGKGSFCSSGASDGPATRGGKLKAPQVNA